MSKKCFALVLSFILLSESLLSLVAINALYQHQLTLLNNLGNTLIARMNTPYHSQKNGEIIEKNHVITYIFSNKPFNLSNTQKYQLKQKQSIAVSKINSYNVSLTYKDKKTQHMQYLKITKTPTSLYEIGYFGIILLLTLASALVLYLLKYYHFNPQLKIKAS